MCNVSLTLLLTLVDKACCQVEKDYTYLIIELKVSFSVVCVCVMNAYLYLIICL